MADVFISYSQTDKELASSLAEILKKQGYSVWWDDHLRAGQLFDERIRAELSKAKVVLVIWTAASSKSEYVRMEAGIGFAEDKLVPVRVSDMRIEDMPKAFRLVQTSDMSDIERIIEVVDEKCGTPTKLPLDEIIQAIGSKNSSLPAILKPWLKRCQQEGLRIIVKRSIMVKGTIPEFGDVNFCTLYREGTFDTNRVAEAAERIGILSIATDYLNSVAALIDGATVLMTGKPWTWRVELHGALPNIATVLPRSEEWIALMKKTQEAFINAAAERSSGLWRITADG